jgi:hypothetical protein
VRAVAIFQFAGAPSIFQGAVTESGVLVSAAILHCEPLRVGQSRYGRFTHALGDTVIFREVVHMKVELNQSVNIIFLPTIL